MKTADLELRDGESLMTDPEELIYRQITEHMVDGDQIASTAFGPMPADKDKPSFSRSERVTAQQSRDWHTRNAASPSLGVWALSVEEVIAHGRHVIDDSAAELAPGEARAPGHCFVDYRGLGRADRKALRARLWLHAVARGEIPTSPTLADGELFALTGAQATAGLDTA